MSAIATRRHGVGAACLVACLALVGMPVAAQPAQPAPLPAADGGSDEGASALPAPAAPMLPQPLATDLPSPVTSPDAAPPGAGPGMLNIQNVDDGAEIARLRATGKTDEAMALIDSSKGLSEPRRQAERALTFLSVGQFSQGVRLLTVLLGGQAAADPWVEANRQALQRALALASANQGTVVLRGVTDGTPVAIDGTPDQPWPAGGRLLIAGRHTLVVKAPGADPVELGVDVVTGQVATLEVKAALAACEVAGQERGPETAGLCCWPGQKAAAGGGGCQGTPTKCPDGMAATDAGCQAASDDAPDAPASDPTGLRLALNAGYGQFIARDESTFRVAGDDVPRITLPLQSQLRVGYRFHRFFGMDLVGNLDFIGTEGDSTSALGKSLSISGALMLDLHTSGTVDPGDVDFMLGVGASPWVYQSFRSDAGDVDLKMVSAAWMAEVGLSFFVATGFAIDVLGTASQLVPIRVCDDVANECRDGIFASTTELSVERLWAVRLGLSLTL